MNNKVYSESYDLLRSWLKSQRESKGLTIRQLAQILGRHHSIIGKVEQSRRKLDIIEFIEYCEALEVNPIDGLKYIIKDRNKTSSPNFEKGTQKEETNIK
jgi:transcriptional regulator with XRE-family HTH domain